MGLELERAGDPNGEGLGLNNINLSKRLNSSAAGRVPGVTGGTILPVGREGLPLWKLSKGTVDMLEVEK